MLQQHLLRLASEIQQARDSNSPPQPHTDLSELEFAQRAYDYAFKLYTEGRRAMALIALRGASEFFETVKHNRAVTEFIKRTM